MDEKLETSTAATTETTAAEPVQSATSETPAATENRRPGPASVATSRPLDLNELQELSGKKLEALARDLDLHLHSARSHHQHILDLIRAALAAGATVTAEGFLDQVSDSFAMLRWPRLNFLPVPEDVCVQRALIDKYHLRPGQRFGGTLRLPEHQL
jgi:transcription termination factor Rho